MDVVKYFLSRTRFPTACFFFCLVLSGNVCSQSWDFDSPEKLSNALNTQYEEIQPLLSPDGKTIFFSRVLHPLNVGGKFSGSDAWISIYDQSKKTWTKPFNPKNTLNDRGNTTVIGVNKGGNVVYLINASSNDKPNGIYFSRKQSNQWSAPELVPIEGLDSKGFFGGYVSPDFDVIFLSMKGPDSRGEEDIYISVKGPTGQWSRPRNLGPAINSAGFEISPFLSHDKKRLYFASNGHKGLGDADIFYCDRLYNSWETWSTPRNLGEPLNSRGFDAYFSLYGDSTAYFVSNRNAKYSDIYKVKVRPGNEVLPFGQRYLTSDEVIGVFGVDVPRRVMFDNSNTTLTPQQKELLYFIADRLNSPLNKDVNVQLTLMEENNPQLTDNRLNAIMDHLRSSGVDNTRFMLNKNERMKKDNKTRTTIDILFFK